MMNAELVNVLLYPVRVVFFHLLQCCVRLLECLGINFGLLAAKRCTEADFVAHIAQTIETDPQAVWLFVTDQLNTHQSESLVRLVAEQCNLSDALGEKGKTGVLQSLPSRAAFLSDPRHRIQFVYVPKHTSWLNQVEIWFSILVRRVIKRGNFPSVDALRERILAFITYFNQTAKPFRWTYTGRPLVT